ncbi:MAG: hypothetical protein WC501_02485 [Candidatus Micrarchaeia archaeon]
MFEFTDVCELKKIKAGFEFHNNLKNLLSIYPDPGFYEAEIISKGKLDNLYSIYELSQKFEKSEKKELKNLGEEIHVLLANSLFKRNIHPERKSDQDGSGFKRSSPFLEGSQANSRIRLLDEIRALGIGSNQLVTAFFDQTLKKYIKTEEGKKELEKLAKDKELFKVFVQALKLKGAIELMVDFLKTKEGIESYIEIGKTTAGLEVFIRLGQIPEGRAVAIGLLKSPVYGWPAIYKILRGLGSCVKTIENVEENFPSYDLKPVLSSKDPTKEILPLLLDPKTLGPIFVSFSKSDENSKLCSRLLENKEIRKIFFDYITANGLNSHEIFTRLLKSKERRKRMSEIFMSKGGTKLLSELAGNIEGRILMTKLAVSDHGRSIGINVLLYHPLTIVKVGFAYFREPVN